MCIILSKQTIEEDNVVMVLGMLSSVVSGAPVDEQIEANAKIIADSLKQTAALLNREGVQLSTEDMMEVSFTNVSILLFCKDGLLSVHYSVTMYACVLC